MKYSEFPFLIYMSFLLQHILVDIIAVIDFLSRLRCLPDVFKAFTTYSRQVTEDTSVISYHFPPMAGILALIFFFRLGRNFCLNILIHVVIFTAP